MHASLHRYSIEKGLLYYCTDAANPPRIVVLHDEYLKYRILYEAHDTAIGGHLGREKTYGMVYQSYWWPKLSRSAQRRMIGINHKRLRAKQMYSEFD